MSAVDIVLQESGRSALLVQPQTEKGREYAETWRWSPVRTGSLWLGPSNTQQFLKGAADAGIVVETR